MNEEAKAAALRLAFTRAAETFPASVVVFLQQTPMGRAENDKLMAFWNEFYRAIVDSQAGLKLLAELERLREGGK